MPEGHTIHRYARLQRRELVGKDVGVSSPQGRFAEGARLLDGRTVGAIDAVGKHLFYDWGDGLILHVHLGLFGRFRTHRQTSATPTAGTRLALQTDSAVIHLAGPTACEILDPDEQQRILGRLGPDPLRRGSSFAEFSHRLDRRKLPIAAALLDQRVIAGIGNVYRAEILFLAGINPCRPARELDDAERRAVWELAQNQLRRGERAGRIVTVDPADVGADRVADIDRASRLYVYKRSGENCRRCHEPIDRAELNNRAIWWCAHCQPALEGQPAVV